MACHEVLSTAGLVHVKVSLELRANAPVDLLQSVRQLEAAKAEANFAGLLLPLQMELTSRDSVASTTGQQICKAEEGISCILAQDIQDVAIDDMQLMISAEKVMPVDVSTSWSLPLQNLCIADCCCKVTERKP